MEDFISEVPVRHKNVLTKEESRVFKYLKTQGERATKGRMIDRCVFEAKQKGRTSLLMIMEGKHSMSVGRQIARRFESVVGVDSSEMIETKNGACVIIRVKK